MSELFQSLPWKRTSLGLDFTSRAVAASIGANTGSNAAIGRLDARTLSGDSTVPIMNLHTDNTVSGTNGWSFWLGGSGDYSGSLKIHEEGQPQDSWSLRLLAAAEGYGVNSTYRFSAPTFSSAINGRGDSDLLKWTNDASNNFSGTADVGQSYAFGGAPVTFSKLNGWIGSTATSTFNIVRHTDTANLFTLVGSTGVATFYPGAVAQATIGDPTVSPYAVLEFMPTDRNTASSSAAPQSMMLVNNTYTTTAASAIAPLGFNFTPTVIFGTDGYGFGSGFLFWSHALIQNNSGSTRSVGPTGGFIDQTNVQANGGTLTQALCVGFLGQPTFNRINSGILNVTSAAAFLSNGGTIGAGATVTAYGHFVASDCTNSGTLTTQVGFDIVTMAAGTTNYGVRSTMAVSGTARYHLYLSGTAPSYINGATGIKQTTPTAYLHIGAGTASANTAPIKIDSGTNTTTAEAGTLEYNGNHYHTKANAIRFGVGGTLFDHYADVGNVGTGEDDLYSDTLAASTLAADGEKVTANFAGIFSGAAAATQELRAYFGGTKIYDSGALAIGVATNNWDMEITVIRESSSVVRCSVGLRTDFGTLFPYSTYTRITGLTLTNTQIIKITGEAAGVGAANNQIVAKLGYVEYKAKA